MKKRYFKAAGRTFSCYLMAWFFCMVIYITFFGMFSNLFTEIIGYKIYEKQTDGTYPVVYEGTYQEGQTVNDIIVNENQKVADVVSDMTQGQELVTNIVIQVANLCVFVWFIAAAIGQFGLEDKHASSFDLTRKKTWFGFKVGLLVSVPGFVSYILLIIYKLLNLNDFWVVYNIINVPFKQVIILLSSNAQSIDQLSLFSMILLALIPILIPAISQFAYLIGYSEGKIGKKIIYKSNIKE